MTGHRGTRTWSFGASLPLCLGVLLQGCVYFNGMYNAQHFAKDAERSERAGRRSEALDRWRIARLHADSVIARHPRSRWVGEAYLVRGHSSVALEAYGDAVVSLEQALRLLDKTEARREAELYLGRANLGIHRQAEALAALDSAVLSNEARRRSLARLFRGRVLMAMRRFGPALEDFRASREQEAHGERVRAALAMGDAALAAAFADSMADRVAFREEQWVPLLDSLGRNDMGERASRLVDRLLRRADVGRGAKARLELADGERRLSAGDSAGASSRFTDVMRSVPDSSESRAADLRLVRLELATVATTTDLTPVREHVNRIVALGGAPGSDAGQLLRVMLLADTLTSLPGPRDAFWFLRGELLRDSVGAPRLAAATFAEMAARFPDSPWTPKGVLAAILLRHPAADSLRVLLAGRYADSPYAAILTARGDQPAAFAVLEDSLARALRAAPVFTTVTQPGVRPGAPPTVAPRPTTRPTIDP